MKAFELTEKKEFMHLLLRSEQFDNFLLSEATNLFLQMKTTCRASTSTALHTSLTARYALSALS